MLSITQEGRTAGVKLFMEALHGRCCLSKVSSLLQVVRDVVRSADHGFRGYDEASSKSRILPNASKTLVLECYLTAPEASLEVRCVAPHLLRPQGKQMLPFFA